MARGQKVLKLRAQAKVGLNLNEFATFTEIQKLTTNLAFFCRYIFPQQKFTLKYENTPAPADGVNGKYYPADDIAAKKGPAPVRNAPKVRASITAGTVLILLAGRFKGKRVVCLKKLESGLLLVSGNYNNNALCLFFPVRGKKIR